MLTLPSERPLQLMSITFADKLIESGCEIMIESILTPLHQQLVHCTPQLER